jgi:putative hydrolase of the HAD superfamily
LKKYKHIFFDLDRTLWDFDKNSSLTLIEIIDRFDLANKIGDREVFCQKYHKHNDFVWDLYRNNQIKKQELRRERFRLLLADFNLFDSKLIESIDKYYVENSPRKPILIDSADDVLEYLNSKYCLHIISNGFQEVQELKLSSSKIRHYFKFIFTSDKIGVSKPKRQFFEYAVKSANARKTESLVIGDDMQNDIIGARNFNIDQIWYNPPGEIANIKPTFEIRHLKEIQDIL